MKHIFDFPNFLNENKKYTIEDFIKENNYTRVTKKGKIKTFLFHGTQCDPNVFSFKAEFERTTHPYDFELPEGLVFLTTDIREASAYGRYVIPIEFTTSKFVTCPVNSDAPSRVFDDDFNYVGKMWSKFFNGGYDALEVKGNYKSTFVSYPEFAYPRIDIAKAFYKV